MNSDIKKELAQTYFKTANSCLASGDHLSAIKNYEQAVILNPRYFKAFCNLGVVYKNIKNYSKSEDAFKKALALNPKDPIILNNLGNVYVELKNFIEAEKAYLKAFQLSHQYRDVIYNLEQLYKAVGNTGKATEFRIKLEQLFRDEPLSEIDNVIITSK